MNKEDDEKIFGNQITFAIETIREAFREYKCRKILKKLYKDVKVEDIALANHGIEDWFRTLDEIDNDK